MQFNVWLSCPFDLLWRKMYVSGANLIHYVVEMYVSSVQLIYYAIEMYVSGAPFI